MKRPAVVAVRLRAELGGEVLGAPGDAGEPRACAAVGAAEEKRCGGFGRERQDLDRAVGEPVQRLARGELGIEMRDRRAAFGLGQQDRIGAAGNHGIEVGIGQAGVERIHAHDELRPVRRAGVLLEIGERGLPRAGLAVRRNRVLEVEDQRIGAGLGPLRELALAVGGNEEVGADHADFGRISMKAWRLHSATSLSFWL